MTYFMFVKESENQELANFSYNYLGSEESKTNCINWGVWMENWKNLWKLLVLWNLLVLFISFRFSRAFLFWGIFLHVKLFHFFCGWFCWGFWGFLFFGLFCCCTNVFLFCDVSFHQILIGFMKKETVCWSKIWNLKFLSSTFALFSKKD